ncbi:hypothetical protein [Variovorax guangxiensis]|nr:hypothetical protein [Variovorax guangxiensis]
MIRSRLFGFASLAFAACLSVGAWSYACVKEPVAAIARTIKAIFLNGFKLAARSYGEGFARPQVLFVQARAFVLRLAKRERPQVSGSWRMCPST